VSVQVATLDILVDRAHLEPEVARAIGDAIVMEIKHARGSLVTSEDLKLAKGELKREAGDLKREMGELIRRAEFEARMVKIDERFTELTQRLEKGFAEIRTEMAQHKVEMTRWMFAGFISTFLANLGAMYFMLQILR
jgi:hypothetical protein